ncbi:SHOCT domain-containing protein [Acetivibrio straminisolvens]|uniref:SHOCT domain-containing protein n=1 Tax=Acetivibrio straminisolvens TaxID=253314 RepID=UPI003C6C63B5
MVKSKGRLRLNLCKIQREVDYWRAYKILQKMLKAGLISEEEFDKIDKLNLKTFSPMYAQLMA